MKENLNNLMLFLLVAVACACSSTDDDNPTPTGSSITITGLSPDNPYIDDVITVSGTGFSADTSKIKIVFGRNTGIFEPYQNHLIPGAFLKVISSSSSEIRFTAKDPHMYSAIVANEHNMTLRVISAGDTAFMEPVSIRLMPSASFSSSVGYANSPLQPNVEYQIYPRGFPVSCDIQVLLSRCGNGLCGFNGTSECDCAGSYATDVCYDPDAGFTSLKIPVSFFGITKKYCEENPMPPMSTYQTQVTFVTPASKKSLPYYVWITMCPGE